MANIVKEEIADVRFLGGIYVLMEEQFRNHDYSDVLNAFLPTLEETHKTHFDTQSDPAANPWPPLAPSTIRRKGHDTILYETGRLKASLAGKTEDSIRAVSERGQGLLFGTSVEYAGFHQDGTRLPRREHVGMVDETLQILVDSVADSAVDSLKEKV